MHGRFLKWDGGTALAGGVYAAVLQSPQPDAWRLCFYTASGLCLLSSLLTFLLRDSPAALPDTFRSRSCLRADWAMPPCPISLLPWCTDTDGDASGVEPSRRHFVLRGIFDVNQLASVERFDLRSRVGAV